MGNASTISPDLQRCIDECQECHAICTHTIAHCLELGGRHAAPEHISVLADCAAACAASADSMLRSSPRHGRFCAICAEMCDACAQDCERMADGDATMEECAKICRRCAESCREMAS
jgi:hypothetical protein